MIKQLQKDFGGGCGDSRPAYATSGHLHSYIRGKTDGGSLSRGKLRYKKKFLAGKQELREL